MRAQIDLKTVLPILARAVRTMTAAVENALTELEAELDSGRGRQDDLHPQTAADVEPRAWHEVERREGVSVTWPKKKGGRSKTTFDPFVVYEADSGGTKIGLGLDPASGHIAVCRIGTRGGSVRPITYFQPTQTGEVIAPIRQPVGRSYLKPGDPLYPPYDRLSVRRFRDMIPSYRNDIMGVVAKRDDAQTMAEHGAVQGALRGL
jgi:hypothetical protein